MADTKEVLKERWWPVRTANLKRHTWARFGDSKIYIVTDWILIQFRYNKRYQFQVNES